MENIIQQIKKANPDLQECEIEGLLYILKNNENLTNNKLITLTGIPKETLRRFKQSIRLLLVDDKSENIRVSKYGKELLENEDLKPHTWSLAERFDFYLDKDIEKVKRIKDKFNLEPKRKYDQFIATVETTYLKCRVLIEKGVVKGKSIVFIGDDDLNSLSLASINKDYKNIVVLDIDKDIVDFINFYANENELKNVTAFLYDARDPLDKKFIDSFDVVVFDPPYTKVGVSLFLQRAFDLLGPVRNFESKYVFMYYGCSFKSPEKKLKIQEIINRYGFTIEDRIEKFARYSGADSIGNASSLYVLKVNSFTKSLGMSFENIYTFEGEKVPEEKFPFVDHLVFKIFDVKKEIILSKRKLVNILESICKIHKLKVVDRKLTEFKVGGMTVSFILANSNLTVHTWPEYGSIHIDLVSCSPIFNKSELYLTLKKYFETDKIDVFFVE